MMITVNVSDLKVATGIMDTLVTYSLGSCIGVTMYDPVVRCGGMLHYQLPASSLDTAKAQQNPCMFADTGMDQLLMNFQAAGGQPRRARVRIAGAAQMIGDSGVFSIGRRNHAAIRKWLWQKGMQLESEAIGGTAPRTVYLRLCDGEMTVKVNGASQVL